jgi:hypothetical protein
MAAAGGASTGVPTFNKYGIVPQRGAVKFTPEGKIVMSPGAFGNVVRDPITGEYRMAPENRGPELNRNINSNPAATVELNMGNDFFYEELSNLFKTIQKLQRQPVGASPGVLERLTRSLKGYIRVLDKRLELDEKLKQQLAWILRKPSASFTLHDLGEIVAYFTPALSARAAQASANTLRQLEGPTVGGARKPKRRTTKKTGRKTRKTRRHQ